MKRFLLVFFFVLCSSLQVFAAPLLQEGKKTLYQRVISHPNAVIYTEASPQSEVVNKGLRPFTALYVYERKPDWLKVGLDTNQAQGWIEAKLTTQWNQSLTLLFTPRTGRDPVLFFRSQKDLKALCQSDDIEKPLRELQKAAAEGRPDPRILAAEPEDSAISKKRFYLMPILEVQEPFDDVKFLRVASINPGEKANKKGQQKAKTNAGAPKTGIAFVMDTSISMGPYINQSINVVKDIYNKLEKEKIAENVGFAMVAFRSSTACTPKLEYTSKVISDFVTVKNRHELESKLSKVHEAKFSSHDFNEDSLAGIYNAIESLNWEEYDSRIIILVSDAGPLRSDDRYSSVRMSPPEIADFAAQKGIWLVALHIKTPSGKENHAYAEKAYKELSKTANGQSNYQAIEAPTAETGAQYFAAVTKVIATNMVKMVRGTAEGRFLTRPKQSPKKNDASPEEEAQEMAERLGYAMQLEYLGKQNKSAGPEVVSSWISDMDLLKLAQKQQEANVQVAVLLTKNQLSDLHDQIKIIIDNAERVKKTDSTGFFQGILSASARMVRDPNMPTKGKNLAELGILGEFLEGLPYKSDVMLLTEEDWYRKSIGEQTSFINRLKSKLARYEEYDRDRANWESFGMYSAGDWVYRIPLEMLP